MTVKELIEVLSKIEDQEVRVMIKGYERGVDDIVLHNNIPAIQQVALNVNQQWYYGKHERVEDIDKDVLSNYTIVNAIIL